MLLPTDVVVAPEASASAPRQVVAVDQAPANGMILDIGPQTTHRYEQAVESAGTVIWNGPLGLFEVEPFAAGTRALAAAVGHCPGTTIVGGGDSIAAIEQAGLGSRITHISTGGGASLEFLGGRTLPGVAALADR
ncbi:MAG: phosphoglycerate kinase [Dehalococcoidia bacterium]|nr:phosphoglycerate kinase [Dehalococcoidia bacterium]